MGGGKKKRAFANHEGKEKKKKRTKKRSWNRRVGQVLGKKKKKKRRGPFVDEMSMSRWVSVGPGKKSSPDGAQRRGEEKTRVDASRSSGREHKGGKKSVPAL